MLCTFYSFKGGVGRSMALANVAELLCRYGLKVLIIDFDLEAPGLERFFDSPQATYKPTDILNKRGLIDLLISYKKLYSLPRFDLKEDVAVDSSTHQTPPFPVEPLVNFITPIYEIGNDDGKLYIIPAGQRAGDEFTRYAERVRSFDWDNFYTEWNGEVFFEWFRQETEAFADVVLIDSRTGITEMGGICTHYLADIVVMFVAPNQQNLSGTLNIAKSLSNPELVKEGRKGRSLYLLPVPSRIENAEAESLDSFAIQFKQTLGNFVEPKLEFEENIFTDLKIPYIPYYAYQERVAVRESERESASDLIKAFEKLTLMLAKLAPENSRFHKFIFADKPSGYTNIFHAHSNKIPQNLPRSGAVKFVGRKREIEQLYQQLQQTEKVAIFAITGMGGIGKTELALQYAQYHWQQKTYLGGVCWLQAQDLSLGMQIVNFGRAQLQLNPPKDLDVPSQVAFCWRHWPTGDVLVVLDDVVDYQQIKPYLPPPEPRFKVLLTTRLQLGQSVNQLSIEVLGELAALELLSSLAGAERIQQQLEQAKALCRWLGYLPLAVELVGRYLARHLYLSLAQMQKRLEEEQLAALNVGKKDKDMTAAWGVKTAFDVSWKTLSDEAKQLGCLLGLFADAPIPWELVQQSLRDQNIEDLEEARDEGLCELHLLRPIAWQTYRLHPLIRQFFQAKLEEQPLAMASYLKQQFCQAMVVVAKQIPPVPTLELIESLISAMPHVMEVVKGLINYLERKEAYWPFIGLIRFWEAWEFYKKDSWFHGQSQLPTVVGLFENLLQYLLDVPSDNHDDAALFEFLELLFQNYIFQQYLYDIGYLERACQQLVNAQRRLEQLDKSSLKAKVLLSKMVAHAYYANPSQHAEDAIENMLLVKEMAEQAYPMASEESRAIWRWYQIWGLDHIRTLLSKLSSQHSERKARFQIPTVEELDAELANIIPEDLQQITTPPKQNSWSYVLRAASYWGHCGNQVTHQFECVLSTLFLADEIEEVETLYQQGINYYWLAIVLRAVNYCLSFPNQDRKYLTDFPPEMSKNFDWLSDWRPKDIRADQFERFPSVSQAVGDIAHQCRGIAVIQLWYYLYKAAREPSYYVLEQARKAVEVSRKLWKRTQELLAPGEQILQYYTWMSSLDMMLELVEKHNSGEQLPPQEYVEREVARKLEELEKEHNLEYEWAKSQALNQIRRFYSVISRLPRAEGLSGNDREVLS